MKKRLFVALFVLLMLAAVCVLCACNHESDSFAIETDAQTGLKYIYTIEGTYIVAGIENYKATEIAIPSTFQGCAVTVIRSGAFKRMESLEKVSIPSSVTSIGGQAFEGCTQLSQVTLESQSNLQTIGDRAFYGCARLGAFEMPKKLSSIGEYAFYDCLSLTELAFPAESHLSDVSVFAFAHCKSLQRVSFGEGCHLSVIRSSAFLNCQSLTSVTIGEGSFLVSIGPEAFSGCGKLAFVDIPDSVQRIGEKAFYNCSSLLSITLSKDLASIGDAAFSGCYKLVEVYNLSSLTVVRGSADLGHAGAYALDVYTDRAASSKLFCDEDGFIFYENVNNCYLMSYAGEQTDIALPLSCHEKPYAVYRYAFYGNSALSLIALSEQTTEIGDFAFAYCASLKEMSIPASVCEIGWYAFAYDKALESVTFAKDSALDGITSGVFISCESLKGVSIPESVSSIGFSAFSGCLSLEAVTLGKNIKSLGRGAFAECLGIKEIHFLAQDVSYCGANVFENAGTSAGIAAYISKDVTKIPAYLFSAAQNLASLIFEEGAVCESIGEGAFLSCRALQAVTIPESITKIGKKAFSECTALSAVYLNAIAIEDLALDAFAFENAGKNGDGISVFVSKEVLRIPAYLFGAEKAFFAPHIKSVTFLEDSLCTYIGDGAFAYLTSLVAFEAPNAIERVGVAAFAGCDSLQLKAFDNAYYIGNSENPYLILLKASGASIVSCQIHADTATIAGEAFSLCTKLESVVLPSALIGIGDGAFKGCRALSQIAIPDAVSAIGTSAFADCTALSAVTFTAQSRLSSIGKGAFARCISLQRFVIPLAVETLGAEVFAGCSSLTVYCKAAKRLDGWSVFWNGSGGMVYWGYLGV